MLDLENFGLVELNAQEVQEVDGGIRIFTITGVLDGIRNNTRIRFFQ